MFDGLTAGMFLVVNRGISILATLVFFVLVYFIFSLRIPGRADPYRSGIVDVSFKLKRVGTEGSLCFDVPFRWQIMFQEPSTPSMEGIIDLHHDAMFYVVLIITFVFYMLFMIIRLFTVWLPAGRRQDYEQFKLSKVTHHTLLEIIWTVIPCIILYTIAVPSFALLYSMEELTRPDLNVKVYGNQWFWTYEYTATLDGTYKKDMRPLRYDSYMRQLEDLKIGEFRLLSVDLCAFLPTNVHIRALVTSNDVLHSWAIPSLGVKIDACPGRLNQIGMFIKRSGYFYGQCSEICGVNHGFMPISIRAVSVNDFYD